MNSELGVGALSATVQRRGGHARGDHRSSGDPLLRCLPQSSVVAAAPAATTAQRLPRRRRRGDPLLRRRHSVGALPHPPPAAGPSRGTENAAPPVRRAPEQRPGPLRRRPGTERWEREIGGERWTLTLTYLDSSSLLPNTILYIFLL